MTKNHVEGLFSKVSVQGLKQKHTDYLNAHDLPKKELSYIKRQLKAFYAGNNAGKSLLAFTTAVVVGVGSTSLAFLNIVINHKEESDLYGNAAVITAVLLALLLLLTLFAALDILRCWWTMRKIQKLKKKKYREAFLDIMIEYRR